MDCPNLLHGINICKDTICDCCVERNEGAYGHPFIMQIQKDENLDLDKLFSLKRKFFAEKIANPSKCKGCLYLRDDLDFSNDDDYISCINFDHWNLCNSKCIYCGEERNGGDFYFNVLPLIQNLFNEKKFEVGGEITFQGGEPTLLPEFEELLTLFLNKGVKIRIHSSGIKYSKTIETGISKGLVTLCVSPDTGIERTYKKIKRNLHFNDVWNNLKNYASFDEANFVQAKMIIVPHYNDDIKEIDAFVKTVKSSKIKTIVIDAESQYCNKYKFKVPNIRFLIDYMKYQCEKENILLEYYDSAKFVLKNTVSDFTAFENKQALLAKYKQIKDKYKKRSVEYS